MSTSPQAAAMKQAVTQEAMQSFAQATDPRVAEVMAFLQRYTPPD